MEACNKRTHTLSLSLSKPHQKIKKIFEQTARLSDFSLVESHLCLPHGALRNGQESVLDGDAR